MSERHYNTNGFDASGTHMIYHNSAQWFDGSTSFRAIPPKHVASLCEQTGCSEDSTTEQYCAAIAAYCANVTGFREWMLWEILSARHPIYPGCCQSHNGLIIGLEMAGLL